MDTHIDARTLSENLREILDQAASWGKIAAGRREKRAAEAQR